MSAFTTIARAFKGGDEPRPARGFIIPLDPANGDAQQIGQRRSFQYFPATISDSHATNYQSKVIPGLSHPLYQWTSGGERTISFEAFFTRDRAMTKSEKDVATLTNTITGIASRLGGAQGANGVSSNQETRDVDIPSAVAWLRSFLLPTYFYGGAGPAKRPLPPKKMILGLPGVRLNYGGAYALNADEMYCVMKGCEVTYDGFFHDGTPRLAKVALSFAEILQVGGKFALHDGGLKQAAGLSGYNFNDAQGKKGG